MAGVILSGSGRAAGKTAVGCALISAIREFSWVAVKVTPHLHGLPAGLWEETELDSPKDTGRYQQAGAIRSFLVTRPKSSDSTGISQLLEDVAQRAPQVTAWVVESGGMESEVLAKVAGPVVSLAVLAGSVEEWKPSLELHLASMDALVLSGGFAPEQLSQELQNKPSFLLPESQWVTAELVAFVRKRLHL